MSDRYEAVYVAETTRLVSSFRSASHRVLRRRQKEGDSPSSSLYRDGSQRLDLDHFGGFGGFSRRMWRLVHHDGRAIYLFEHARRIKPNATELEDIGTFGLAVSYPTLYNYPRVEISDNRLQARYTRRHDYDYQPREDLGRLVIYPDKVCYQGMGIYIGSIDLGALHKSDLTIDQIILTTEALDTFYTDEYFAELSGS